MARKRKLPPSRFVPTGGFLKDRPTPRITEKSHFLKELEAKQAERLVGILKSNVEQIRKRATS